MCDRHTLLRLMLAPIANQQAYDVCGAAAARTAWQARPSTWLCQHWQLVVQQTVSLPSVHAPVQMTSEHHCALPCMSPCLHKCVVTLQGKSSKVCASRKGLALRQDDRRCMHAAPERECTVQRMLL